MTLQGLLDATKVPYLVMQMAHTLGAWSAKIARDDTLDTNFLRS